MPEKVLDISCNQRNPVGSLTGIVQALNWLSIPFGSETNAWTLFFVVLQNNASRHSGRPLVVLRTNRVKQCVHKTAAFNTLVHEQTHLEATRGWL